MEEEKVESTIKTHSKKSTGKTSHGRKFNLHRKKMNEKDNLRDVQDYDRLVSTKLIELRLDVQRDAPKIEFSLTTKNFQFVVSRFVGYAKAINAHIFNRWADGQSFEKALSNVISDMLVWRYCTSKHSFLPGLRLVYEHQERAIKTFLNTGPMLPVCIRNMLLLTGDFQVGDLQQWFIPKLVSSDRLDALMISEVNQDLSVLRFMVDHAICVYPYGTRLQWIITIESADLADNARIVLSRYGSVVYNPPTDERPGVFEFIRMIQSDVFRIMMEFKEGFENRLRISFTNMRSSDHHQPGSVAQLAFYGDRLSTLSATDRACGPVLMSTHDLQVGAALFSPEAPSDFWHVSAENIRCQAQAEPQAVIIDRLVRMG